MKKKKAQETVVTVQDSPSWKNESEDGTVVESVPPQKVCQQCDGGLVLKTNGLYDRCEVCLGTGFIQ